MKANATSLMPVGAPGMPTNFDNSNLHKSQASFPPSSPAGSLQGNNTSISVQDRYGLRGLLSIIRMDNPDASMLSLGSDLTSLGLNLNQPE